MGKKILVCDDDEAILEMLKIMLENEGFEVKILENGKAILRKVIEYQPNLILIDIWMPGIDGKEAIKLLKQDPQTNAIPIFIISALHENEVGQIVKKVGVEGFLAKPFDLDELITIAKKHTSL